MATERAETEQVRQWVLDHGDALYRYAVSMVRDQTKAEDLVQDTFLAALKATSKFAGRSNPRTWLIGILRHKILDAFRRESLEAKHTASSDEDVDADLFDAQGRWLKPPAAVSDDPHQVLASREFEKALNGCLDRLDGPKRAAILLRAFEGLSSQEVCKELEITPTNLWVLVHRARGILRRCLEQNWFGPREF